MILTQVGFLFPLGVKFLYNGPMLMNLAGGGLLALLFHHSRCCGLFLLISTGMSPGEDSPDDGGRGAGPLHQIQGDLPQPAHPAGA